MTFQVTGRIFDPEHYAKLVASVRIEIEAEDEEEALEAAFLRFRDEYPGKNINVAAEEL